MNRLIIYIEKGHTHEILGDFPYLSNQVIEKFDDAPDFDIVHINLQSEQLTYAQELILNNHRYVKAFTTTREVIE